MNKLIKRIALVLAIVFSISIFTACNLESLVPSKSDTPSSAVSVTPESFSYLGETYSPHITSMEQFCAFYQYAVFYKIDKAYLYLDFLGLGVSGDTVRAKLNEAADTVDVVYSCGTQCQCIDANQMIWKFEFSNWGDNGPNNTTKTEYPDEYYTPIANLVTVKSADANKREEGFDDFNINSLTKSASVTTSEQLYYVVSKGVKPIPTNNSIAATIYNTAKDVLREIVDDTMTDTEKVIAICDWLSKNITYDGKMLELTNTKRYNAHFLEGAFIDHRAVCDGFSKAFVLLARIEGIEAIMVEGEAGFGDKGPHAWNKVNMPKDNEAHWYVVDNTWNNSSTSGDFDLEVPGEENYEQSTRFYTFVTDNDIEDSHVESAGGNYPKALGGNTDVDTYSSIYYKAGTTLKINSKSQLKELLIWIKAKLDSEEWEGVRFSMIDMDVNYNYGGNFGSEVSELNTLYHIGLNVTKIRFSSTTRKQYMIFIP